MSLERFEFDVNDVIPANLCNILTLLFCIFLLILERTFALCNAIPANEHTQFANGGLRVNPWNFWLMQFCFTIKKIILSQNCYFDLRFPVPITDMLPEFTLAKPLNTFRNITNVKPCQIF